MFSFNLDSGLTLELLAPRHAQELYEVVDQNRAHLRPWMPWVESIKSASDTKAFISATRTQISSNSGFQTAIRLGEKLVGVVGMHTINWENKFTSLGYWLAKDAQGKGIMTRACAAYISHSFEELELHRVEIRCATDNSRSRRNPERLGFDLEGTIREAERVDGRFVDHAVYGLLSSEWEKRSAPS